MTELKINLEFPSEVADMLTTVLKSCRSGKVTVRGIESEIVLTGVGERKYLEDLKHEYQRLTVNIGELRTEAGRLAGFIRKLGESPNEAAVGRQVDIAPITEAVDAVVEQQEEDDEII